MNTHAYVTVFRLDSELRKWIDTYPTDNATNTSAKISDDSKLTSWPLIFASHKKVKKNSLGRRFHTSAEMLVIFDKRRCDITSVKFISPVAYCQILIYAKFEKNIR